VLCVEVLCQGEVGGRGAVQAGGSVQHALCLGLFARPLEHSGGGGCALPDLHIIEGYSDRAVIRVMEKMVSEPPPVRTLMKFSTVTSSPR
jgi:hypothetical protein